MLLRKVKGEKRRSAKGVRDEIATFTHQKTHSLSITTKKERVNGQDTAHDNQGPKRRKG